MSMIPTEANILVLLIKCGIFNINNQIEAVGNGGRTQKVDRCVSQDAGRSSLHQ